MKNVFIINLYVLGIIKRRFLAESGKTDTQVYASGTLHYLYFQEGWLNTVEHMKP